MKQSQEECVEFQLVYDGILKIYYLEEEEEEEVLVICSLKLINWWFQASHI